MSVEVKQALAFLSPLPWQCPRPPAGGISCPSPCTVIWTGTGTSLLTLHPKVGHEVWGGFLYYFYWDTPVILVLSVSTRGMQLFLYLQA